MNREELYKTRIGLQILLFDTVTKANFIRSRVFELQNKVDWNNVQPKNHWLISVSKSNMFDLHERKFLTNNLQSIDESKFDLQKHLDDSISFFSKYGTEYPRLFTCSVMKNLFIFSFIDGIDITIEDLDKLKISIPPCARQKFQEMKKEAYLEAIEIMSIPLYFKTRKKKFSYEGFIRFLHKPFIKKYFKEDDWRQISPDFITRQAFEVLGT